MVVSRSPAVTGRVPCVSMGRVGTGEAEAGTESRLGGDWAGLLGEVAAEPGSEGLGRSLLGRGVSGLGR